jgi:flagellar assembly factor FliW
MTEPADQTAVLEFVTPPPGFPGWSRGELVKLDDAGLLYALRDVDASDLRLLVAPPWPFFPDYEPEIDDDSVAALGLADAADTAVFVVVNPGEDVSGATANLRAPIVVNVRTNRAAQVVLADAELPVQAALQAA